MLPVLPLLIIIQTRNAPEKVRVLGIGAYRVNTTRPWVLPVVRKVQLAIANDNSLNTEYLHRVGLPGFTSAASNLLLDPDSPVVKKNQVLNCQSFSGTGALLAGRLVDQDSQPQDHLLLKPTWGNHLDIFKYAGCDEGDPTVTGIRQSSASIPRA